MLKHEKGRTKMPSQEAASKSGDSSVARPNFCAGSTSGGCASTSVSLTSLPAAVPVPYLIRKGVDESCGVQGSPQSAIFHECTALQKQSGSPQRGSQQRTLKVLLVLYT